MITARYVFPNKETAETRTSYLAVDGQTIASIVFIGPIKIYGPDPKDPERTIVTKKYEGYHVDILYVPVIDGSRDPENPTISKPDALTPLNSYEVEPVNPYHTF